MPPKPLKVWTEDRKLKQGVVASSLEDLISKGSVRLDLKTTPVSVVLEEDGTAVEDEEYFQTLTEHTVLLLLTEGQHWQRPSYVECTVHYDETDRAATESAGDRLSQLLARLRHDLGYIAVLGGRDLELLADLDPERCTELGVDLNFAEEIKEASSRYLDGRREVEDALNLLQVYNKTRGAPAVP